MTTNNIRATPAVDPTQNSGWGAAEGAAVGGVVGLAICANPIGLLAAALAPAFSFRETDGARSAGRAKMNSDECEWKVPDSWWQAAQAIEDPQERADAIARLTEIESFMTICGAYCADMAPEVKGVFMSTVLGSGVDMEDGTMGDVFSVILSGNSDLLPQVMGDDGGFLAFGEGDGLDIDEWEKIKTTFTEGLEKMKTIYDVKLPTEAEKVFDARQQGTLNEYLAARHQPDEEEEEP